jgi:hypothetical protein
MPQVGLGLTKRNTKKGHYKQQKEVHRDQEQTVRTVDQEGTNDVNDKGGVLKTWYEEEHRQGKVGANLDQEQKVTTRVRQDQKEDEGRPQRARQEQEKGRRARAQYMRHLRRKGLGGTDSGPRRHLRDGPRHLRDGPQELHLPREQGVSPPLSHELPLHGVTSMSKRATCRSNNI